MERKEDEGRSRRAGKMHDENRSQCLSSLRWIGEGRNRTQQQKRVLKGGVHKLSETITT